EGDQDNGGETPGEGDQDNGGETPGEDDQDNGGETPGEGDQDNGGQTPGKGDQDNGGQIPGEKDDQGNGGQAPGGKPGNTPKPEGNSPDKGNNSTKPNVTVKPIVNGNKATVTDEQLKDLKNKGTLIIDLQDTNKTDVSIEFTADQIELLKDKKIEIQIANGDVNLSIPTSVLTNGSEKTSIHILKLKDIQNALSPVYDFTITQGGQVISQFSEGVTLTFNVDDSRVSNPDNVKVFYWNPSTSKWEPIGGSYSNGVVTATTTHFSVYTVFETSSEEVSSPGKSLVPVQQNGKELPNTATNSFNWLLIGLTILLVSCAALFIFQRRKMLN
ncbi:LPXTG cell wall anchor domain-containing protein, partial [Robertmurraya sp.]|uniref:LPXTG cell wall anchor domain-containing protein n=1 Tax=Robertmurraya sp. TaxID=2837525 RepID=UPI003704605F